MAEKGEVPKSFNDANPSVKEHAGSFWLKAAVVWKEHPCRVCAILTVLMLTALAFGLILGLASEDKLDRLPTTVRTGTVKLKDSSENNGVMIPYIINCTVTVVRAQSVVEETEDEIVVTNDDADPAELSAEADLNQTESANDEDDGSDASMEETVPLKAAQCLIRLGTPRETVDGKIKDEDDGDSSYVSDVSVRLYQNQTCSTLNMASGACKVIMLTDDENNNGPALAIISLHLRENPHLFGDVSEMPAPVMLSSRPGSLRSDTAVGDCTLGAGCTLSVEEGPVPDELLKKADSTETTTDGTSLSQPQTDGRRNAKTSQVADVGEELPKTMLEYLRSSTKRGLYVMQKNVMTLKWGHKSWYRPNVDAAVRNFEMQATPFSTARVYDEVPATKDIYSEGFTLKTIVDWTQGGQCPKAFDTRANVYVKAKACIGLIFTKWCYVNIHKDDIVKLSLSPVATLDLNLKPQANGELVVSTKLTGLSIFGFQGDLGDISVKINLVPILLSVFDPIIGIGLNLLANKYIKSRIQEFISRVEKDLPGMATDIAKKAIISGLPKPMVIKPSPAVAKIVSILERNQPGSYSLIKAQMDNMASDVLASLPAESPLNKGLMCSGSGLIHTYASSCMRNKHFGSPGEVYCIDGIKRFCLGNQMCPWRDIGSSTCAAGFSQSECSLGGLVTADKPMIDAFGSRHRCERRCSGWWIFRRCRRYCRCYGASARITCNEGKVQ